MIRRAMTFVLVLASTGMAQDSPANPSAAEKLAPIPLPDYSRIHPEAKAKVELMRDTVRSSRQSAAAWDELGATCHVYQLYDCAEASYREAHRLSPRQFFYTYHLALILDRKPPTEELVTILQKVIGMRPTYLPAHWRLGKALQRLGREDDAIAAFKRLIGMAPQFGLGHKGLGEILLAKGEVKKAIEHLEQARANLPEDGTTYASLAIAYRRIGNDKLANDMKVKSDSIDTTFTLDDPILKSLATGKIGDATLLANAKQLVSIGKYDEAIPDLLSVVQVTPEDLMPHVLLATSFRATNQLGRGLQHAEKALHIDATSMSAHLELAAIYLKMGELDLGMDYYARAQGLDPQNGKIDTWIADILLQQGYLSQTIMAYERAESYDALDANAHWKWGLALGEKGDLQGAIKHFNAALGMNPNYPNAYFSLGMAYEKLKQPAKAKEQYLKALEIDPNHLSGKRLQRLEQSNP